MLLIFFGLFGAGLLYGDGMITPAISVLSAVEGLEIPAPGMKPYVVPIAVLILLVLFAIQRRGTAGIGSTFGPIMLVWFFCIGFLGALEAFKHPAIFASLNPTHAVRFFIRNKVHGFIILGVVFLVVTGGEALYADMGHFGKRPIRAAWFGCVMPSLLLNYFGQGAFILANPSAVANPFTMLAPPPVRYPLIALSMVSTVIASQAVISGAFSLTMQAVQLGYLPRLAIRHTSQEQYGQVYVPAVNWFLLAATIVLVLSFGSSSRLAAAYGVAVTTTMMVTTVLIFYAMRRIWKWNILVSSGIAMLIMAVDLSFFLSNAVKIPDGGWFPLIVGIGMLAIMATWWRGQRIVDARIRSQAVTYADFFSRIERDPPGRIPGTEIHLHANPEGVPPSLPRNIHYNRVLHDTVVVVSVAAQRVPFVDPADRASLERPSDAFFLVALRFGFMERPDVPAALKAVKELCCSLNIDTATYVMGHLTIMPSVHPLMLRWQERLFSFLARNAESAFAYFGIPPEQVLILGGELEI